MIPRVDLGRILLRKSSEAASFGGTDRWPERFSPHAVIIQVAIAWNPITKA